jgi:histidine triad (HIT) family protein
MDCIFCDIINKKSYAEVLFENESAISFLDIKPINYGHTLVIPKIHYENFLDLPEDELSELIKVTKNISGAIVNSLNPEGFNVVTNNGIAAGQSVFHFHFHIIPRFKDEDFRFRLKLKEYKIGLMQEYANKIRAAVSV